MSSVREFVIDSLKGYYERGPVKLGKGELSSVQGYFTTASGEASHAEGFAEQLEYARIIASGTGSHAEGYAFSVGKIVASGTGSHAEGCASDEGDLVASGFGSHAEGESTVASGSSAHAEGGNTKALGGCSHAEGNNTKASGSYSHAEGSYTNSSGISSHAEGDNTVASGYASHAEGIYTTASGSYSHAEGNSTLASGYASHAEGIYTTASGYISHAEGQNTITSNRYEHAQGCYNATASGQIFSIGCGNAEANRKNAISVITGSTTKVYVEDVGGYNGKNPTNTNDLASTIKSLDYPKESSIDYTSLEVQPGEFCNIDLNSEEDNFTITLMTGTQGLGRTEIWGGVIRNISEFATVDFTLEDGTYSIQWAENTPTIVSGKEYEFNVIKSSGANKAYGILVEYSE